MRQRDNHTQEQRLPTTSNPLLSLHTRSCRCVLYQRRISIGLPKLAPVWGQTVGPAAGRSAHVSESLVVIVPFPARRDGREWNARPGLGDRNDKCHCGIVALRHHPPTPSSIEYIRVGVRLSKRF